MNKTQNVPVNFKPWRMMVLYGAIAAVFGFYTLRLFNYQVLNGAQYAEQAEENRITKISQPTQRGIIFDRNGVVLARNIASYNVVITPADLPVDATVDTLLEPNGAVQEVFRELSKLIGVPVSAGEITDETVLLFKPCDTDFGITQIAYIGDTNAPYDPVRIKCNISQEIAMVIYEKSADWPGVGIEIEPVRDYPTGVLTSEVVGFLGPIPAVLEETYRARGFVPNRDKIGYAGVESSLQPILEGKNGERLVEVDVAGKELRTIGDAVPAVAGQNVRLTIDAKLQMAARTALVGEIDSWNALAPEPISHNGVVIAMNPRTGEILALVSYPTFENNRMARVIPGDYYQQLQADPNRPLFNHAVSAEHPPGSVFKMATAVGILNEGVVTPEKVLEDPGKITILQKFSPNDAGTPIDYVCWPFLKTNAGHGDVNFIRAVAESCDVYFYKVGGGYGDEVKEGLNIWRIGEYARALGYGEVTGIELPGEADGLIPDPTWKRLSTSLTGGENWSTGDTYISTIGQGFVLATPLQVLQSIATIINDGKRMQPTLVHEILDSEGNIIKPFQPRMQVDITKTPVINVYDENFMTTGEKKTVDLWALKKAQEGMRETVVNGTVKDQFAGFEIPSGGKTGTAEYCDDIANKKDLCKRGLWPAHAWYVGYAPYDDPEIVVMAFVYNGKEGSLFTGPIVRKTLEAYFELKAIQQSGGVQTP